MLHQSAQMAPLFYCIFHPSNPMAFPGWLVTSPWAEQHGAEDSEALMKEVSEEDEKDGTVDGGCGVLGVVQREFGEPIRNLLLL